MATLTQLQAVFRSLAGTVTATIGSVANNLIASPTGRLQTDKYMPDGSLYALDGRVLGFQTAAIASVAAIPTTANAVTLFNNDPNKTYFVVEATAMMMAATSTVPSSFALIAGVQPVLITNLAAGGLSSSAFVEGLSGARTFGRAGGGSATNTVTSSLAIVGLGSAIGTLTNAPIWFPVLGGTEVIPAGTIIGIGATRELHRRPIVLPYGGAMSLHLITQAAANTGTMGLVWVEIPNSEL